MPSLSNNENSPYFKKCIHDIRNMKFLNQKMIDNISEMSSKEKMEIIILYNSLVEMLKDMNNL